MNGRTTWTLGLVILIGVISFAVYTKVFQASSEPAEIPAQESTLTRSNLVVPAPVVPVTRGVGLPAPIVSAPFFPDDGAAKVKISIVSLPDRAPVKHVVFWGTLMNQWEVFKEETEADGTALVALPTHGMWEFLCFAPGLGAGRVFNVDSARRAGPWVIELQPFASSIQLRVVDAKTKKTLTGARFLSRNHDPDVLAYGEPLASLPPFLNGTRGNLNLPLDQPNIAYVWVEADGYQPAAVSIFEGGVHEVGLEKLQAKALQVLEQGHPVEAKVSVTFHAAKHRFGTYAHSTLRPPETYLMDTSQDGFVAIALPSRLEHGGFELSISSESGTTRRWSHMQWASIPATDWVIDLAE